MYPAIICLIFWFLSLILETTFFTLSNWFQPNLFFLVAIIFCIHWRGPESYYVALIFGLTADCFSTLPFGIYGLTYFLLSFIMRWYAIKIYQEALITLPFVAGIFTLVMNGLVLITLKTIFSVGEFTSWFTNIMFNEVIPTAVVAIPVLKGLIFLEKRYRIRLSERKF